MEKLSLKAQIAEGHKRVNARANHIPEQKTDYRKNISLSIICKFNTIPTKIPMEESPKFNNVISKFIWGY